MEHFYPIAIVELQNILSTKNIERLKAEFFKKNYHPENSPDLVDSDKGILYYYDGQNDDFLSKKFEDYLKEILWNATNKLKAEIDLSRIKLNQTERIKYWDEILFSFNRINDSREELIKKFPIIKKVFLEIDNYFNEKYNFQTEDVLFDDYFILKSKHTKNDIITIYRFLTRNDYINGIKYSEEHFLSVFFDSTTENIIEFNSFTYLLVFILEKMGDLFLDLKPAKIGESKRFKTKGSKNKPSELLNAGNYSKAKNAYKKKLNNIHLQKVETFFQNNFSK